MIRKISRVAAALCGLLVFVSCQAVFTYSPVTFLERDLANLSPGQQAERAESVLVSGSAEEIAEAYDAVVALIAAGDATAETGLLAADLAFAASGINDVVADLLSDPDLLTSATSDDISEILGALDLDLIDAGAAFVTSAAAVEGAEISDSQYIIAGAALMMSAAEDAGGFEIFETEPSSGDPGFDDFTAAMEFLSAAGIEDFGELLSF